MLNLDQIVENYAKEIGGKVIPYTDNKSVIIVPTFEGRFQKVIGWTRYGKKYKLLEFNSKVCPYSDELSLAELLENASTYCFTRLILKDNYLEVAAAIVVEHANESLIKDLIYEVATRADLLEMKLVGEDYH